FTAGGARLFDGWWPLALVAAGALLIALGDERRPRPSFPFRVEQEALEDADLLASSGTADLRLGARSGMGELAAGERPWAGGPQVQRAGERATLWLERAWTPAAWRAASWRVDLSPRVAWRLNLRTTTGAADLDLAELTVTALRLRSVWGDARVTLPATV